MPSARDRHPASEHAPGAAATGEATDEVKRRQRKSGLAFCGRCGSDRLGFDGAVRHECAACGWVLYRSPAAAVFAILRDGGNLVLVRRAADPGRGKLDLPGGFVDPGETAEAAIRREIREEIGVDVEALAFVRSYPNLYRFREVEYDTLDLCFAGRVHAPAHVADREEIAEVVTMQLADIEPDELAFDSVRAALADFARATERG